MTVRCKPVCSVSLEICQTVTLSQDFRRIYIFILHALRFSDSEFLLILEYSKKS